MRKMKLALSVSRMSKLFVLTAVLTLMCLGGIAHADSINYTVSGWGPTSYPAPTAPAPGALWGPNGYPGDTLELLTMGSLNLVPGSYTQKINTLLWTINYTYGGTATDPSEEAWRDLPFNVDASRTIDFGFGTSGLLSQTGLLEVKWDNDYLTFNDGTTTSLIVRGYKVDITPLGFDRVEGLSLGGQPTIDIMARFDVSAVPVPIPPSVLLLGSSLAGLAGLRRKFKNYMNK
jgi:hypothetical protein